MVNVTLSPGFSVESFQPLRSIIPGAPRLGDGSVTVTGTTVVKNRELTLEITRQPNGHFASQATTPLGFTITVATNEGDCTPAKANLLSSNAGGCDVTVTVPEPSALALLVVALAGGRLWGRHKPDQHV